MEDMERERKRPNVKEKGEEQRLMELLGYKNDIYRKGKEAATGHGEKAMEAGRRLGKRIMIYVFKSVTVKPIALHANRNN